MFIHEGGFIMEFEAKLKDFAKKYDLNYAFQEFENCWELGYFVNTYSLYNKTGCFTIQYIIQKNELDFYFSKKFSTFRKFLCVKNINVFKVGQDIWEKRQKIWIFKNPFYYWSVNNTINVLIEVMEDSIKNNGEFFGVRIIE